MPRGKTGEKNYKNFGLSITNKKLQEKFEKLKKEQKLSSTVQHIMCRYYSIEEIEI